jgi:hypothetical protein
MSREGNAALASSAPVVIAITALRDGRAYGIALILYDTYAGDFPG